MAKLKLVVDSLDDLDETARTLYVERDGKFHLDVDGVEDTSGLKSALQKERKEREARERQVKAWERLGKSPEEIEELLEAQRKADEEKATKAGEWEKLRAQMNEKHQAELAKKDEALAAMRRRLEAELVDAKAVAAIAAAKGVPELLLPHVQRHVKVDDDFNVLVVDAKGDPRVNSKGEPLTIADLVSEMRQSDLYGRAFEGSGQTGSGKQPDKAGGPGSTPGGVPKSWAEAKTPQEKAAYLKAQASP